MEKTPSLLIPTKLMDLMDLRHQAEELKTLCDRFDPFAPDTAPDVRELLHKYSLKKEDGSDPFQITNELILLLENTLEELQKREKN